MEVLSLVGLPQHACKVVIPGKLFMSWMYSTAGKLKYLSHYISLNKDFRSDTGGTLSLTAGTGQAYSILFFTIPPLTAASRPMLPGHGTVPHSSSLTGFSTCGSPNGLASASWQKNWSPASLVVLSEPLDSLIDACGSWLPPSTSRSQPPTYRVYMSWQCRGHTF